MQARFSPPTKSFIVCDAGLDGSIQATLKVRWTLEYRLYKAGEHFQWQ